MDQHDASYPFEPWHDKTNKMTVHPAKTQISLGTHPVWSESSLSAWRKLVSLATHWAHIEDSDAEADPSLCWAHTVFVGFVMTVSHLMFFLSLCPYFEFRYSPDNSYFFNQTPKPATIGPRQANLVLIAYASSEGSGEPAHPRSLARTFAARSYKQCVKRNLQTESQIPGPSECLGRGS